MIALKLQRDLFKSLPHGTFLSTQMEVDEKLRAKLLRAHYRLELHRALYTRRFGMPTAIVASDDETA